jgi:hypothetical protein
VVPARRALPVFPGRLTLKERDPCSRMVPPSELNRPFPGRTSSRPRPRAAYRLPLSGELSAERLTEG